MLSTQGHRHRLYRSRYIGDEQIESYKVTPAYVEILELYHANRLLQGRNREMTWRSVLAMLLLATKHSLRRQRGARDEESKSALLA